MRRESDGVENDARFILDNTDLESGGDIFGVTTKKTGFNLKQWSVKNGSEFHVFIGFNNLDKTKEEITAYLKAVSETLSAYYTYFDLQETVSKFSAQYKEFPRSKIPKIFKFTYLDKSITNQVDPDVMKELKKVDTNNGIIIDCDENSLDALVVLEQIIKIKNSY